MSQSIFAVMDVTHPSPEPFAVVSIHLDRPTPCGGVVATVVSLHMDRAEAERVVASGPATETRQ